MRNLLACSPDSLPVGAKLISHPSVGRAPQKPNPIWAPHPAPQKFQASTLAAPDEAHALKSIEHTLFITTKKYPVRPPPQRAG